MRSFCTHHSSKYLNFSSEVTPNSQKMGLSKFMNSYLHLSKNSASRLLYKDWRNISFRMQTLQEVSLWDWAVPLWVSHPSVPGRLHKGRGKLSLVKESVPASLLQQEGSPVARKRAWLQATFNYKFNYLILYFLILSILEITNT